MVKGVAPATLMVSDLLVQFVKPPSCSWPLYIGRNPRCNFPFKYNESLYFEPVVVDDKKMCSTAKNTKDKEGEYKDYIQEVFKKTFQECSPCTQGRVDLITQLKGYII